MTLRVVYDTNVAVSATLQPAGIPAALIALAIAKRVRLVVSPPIVEEYHNVLIRPKFALDAHTVAGFLHDLTTAATMVHPTKTVAAALDEDDNRFLECA